MGSNHAGGPHGLQFDYESTLPATDGMSLYYRTGPEQISFEDSTGTSGNKVMVVGRSGSVGIGISSPVSKLHLYQDNASTSTDVGLTVEQDGTGDATVQYLLTGVKRWVTGIDNSDSDKFVIDRDWETLS